MVLSILETGTSGTWKVVDETVHDQPISVENKVYSYTESMTFLIERAPSYNKSYYINEYDKVINGSVNRNGNDGVYTYSLLTIPDINYFSTNRAEFDTHFTGKQYYHENNKVYVGDSTIIELTDFTLVSDIENIEPDGTNIAFVKKSHLSVYLGQKLYNETVLNLVNTFNDCPECFKSIKAQNYLDTRDVLYVFLKGIALKANLTLGEINDVTSLSEDDIILINRYTYAISGLSLNTEA